MPDLAGAAWNRAGALDILVGEGKTSTEILFDIFYHREIVERGTANTNKIKSQTRTTLELGSSMPLIFTQKPQQIPATQDFKIQILLWAFFFDPYYPLAHNHGSKSVKRHSSPSARRPFPLPANSHHTSLWRVLVAARSKHKIVKGAPKPWFRIHNFSTQRMRYQRQ